MGSFVVEIINKQRKYSEQEIIKQYDSFYSIDDFLFELIDYLYSKIDNKKIPSSIEIDNFNTYLNKYFTKISKDNLSNMCIKIDGLYKRILQVISSKPKIDQHILIAFSNDLKEFLDFESYDSSKYDLEQIEIGNKLDKIIFEEQNECIFEMVKKSDKICKFKYRDGEILINKVYSCFKGLVKDNCDYNQSVDFYQKLIFEILVSDCYKKSNKIKEVIDDLRVFRKTLNSRDKNKVVQILINKLEILNVSSITIDEKEKFIKHLLSNYDINVNFSSSIERVDDLVSCRTNDIKDFRNKNIITMDSKFKSAYDDAISLEKTDNGYLLGIYITDVASFVGVDSLLYNHAKQRGESIYTSEDNNNFYIPMFPVDLTRNFFSLNKDCDRQVIAYLFYFSDSFDLISYEFNNAVINVKNNYSFECIDRINPSDSNYDMINLLIKLTDVLSKNFNSNYHFLKEKNSSFSRNSKYSLSIGSKIISTSTLFLNAFIAERFKKFDWPYIYRVNETEVPIEKLYFSNLDNLVKKYRSSRYSCEPNGHAGNNMSVYGHITNPIRSYASYMNQYFFEYLFLDWVSFPEKIKFIRYWNDMLPSIVDDLNSRLEKNKEFVSVMQELNSKRLTKKK